MCVWREGRGAPVPSPMLVIEHVCVPVYACVHRCTCVHLCVSVCRVCLCASVSVSLSVNVYVGCVGSVCVYICV